MGGGGGGGGERMGVARGFGVELFHIFSLTIVPKLVFVNVCNKD